jgi:hypothetical protein
MRRANCPASRFATHLASVHDGTGCALRLQGSRPGQPVDPDTPAPPPPGWACERISARQAARPSRYAAAVRRGSGAVLAHFPEAKNMSLASMPTTRSTAAARPSLKLSSTTQSPTPRTQAEGEWPRPAATEPAAATREEVHATLMGAGLLVGLVAGAAVGGAVWDFFGVLLGSGLGGLSGALGGGAAGRMAAPAEAAAETSGGQQAGFGAF